MSRDVNLEWTVIEEDEAWSAPPKLPPAPRPRWQRILARAALSMLLIFAAASLFAWYRIQREQHRLRADFQALVDLEARAIRNGDRELYLSLSSRQDSAWFQTQQSLFDSYIQVPTNWPHLQVTHVELVDDYAWVQTQGPVAGTDEPIRWMRFFRWTGQTWRMAPPDERYWGPLQEQEIGQLRFVYHERDEPYVESIAQELNPPVTQLCQFLGCTPSLRVTVELVPPHSGGWPTPSPLGTILLPSPSAQAQLVSGQPIVSTGLFQPDNLAYYLAFETAGGAGRWEQPPDDGAWLVVATADWARAQIEQVEQAQRDENWDDAPSREFLRLIVSNGNTRTLQQVWRAGDVYTNSYLARIQYYARARVVKRTFAHAVIDYIIATYGNTAIPDLLASIGRHQSIAPTLETALGIPLTRAEPDWQTWLQAHYGTRTSASPQERKRAKSGGLNRYTVFEISGGQSRWEATSTGRLLAGVIAYQGELHQGLLAAPLSQIYGQGHALMQEAIHAGLILPLEELWQQDPALNLSPESFATMPSDRLLTDTLQKPDDATLIVFPNTWSAAHALSVAEYVTSAYGQKGVRDLLAALGHNVTLTGTLRDGLDVDVDEFERGWQAWLRERYGD